MTCRPIWGAALCASIIAFAHATTPAAAAPGVAVTLTPAVGPPTAKTTVSGSGYAGREAVAVRFDGVGVGSAVAGAAGKFSLAVTVPASALPGLHTVEAIGDAGGSSARAPFRVRTDWPQGCFDAARRCFNQYENVLDPAGARALAPAWRAAVGTDGRSAPVYASGRLFIGTEAGLVGLDPATGTIIINDRSGPVSTTPAVIRGFDPQPDPPGKVIFGSRDGILHAVATTGRPLWQMSLGGAPTSPVVLQRPGAARARIIVGAGNRLLALDADGKRLWTTVLEGGDISKAAAVFTAPPEPERVIVAAGNRLYALDATTGAVLWSVEPSGSPLGAPSIGDPTILIGDQAGTLFSIDARRGTLRSRFPAAGPISGSAAIGDPNQSGPHVFLGDGGGDIYAIDQTDDLPAPIWQAVLGGPVDGPPVLANGVVYAASDPVEGDPHIAALDAASGRPLFAATLPGGAAGSPIVADGRLIVATRNGDLIAYDGPDS